MKRPDWNEYFMRMTNLARTRSACIRRGVGAVIVRDRMVVSTGYNGPPKGVAHCSGVGCLRSKMGVPSGQRHELCRGLHAEQNAIIQAAYHGVPVKGCVLFCTTKPCIICMKMIINAGIWEVYYAEDYDDEMVDSMAFSGGIKMFKQELKGGD